MAIINIPRISRLRFTYPTGMSSCTFSGISLNLPSVVLADRVARMAGAMAALQVAPPETVSVITESELMEEQGDLN